MMMLGVDVAWKGMMMLGVDVAWKGMMMPGADVAVKGINHKVTLSRMGTGFR